MKRNDWIIIIVGLFLAVTAFILVRRPVKENSGGEVMIYQDGVVKSVIPLNQNEYITVKGDNGEVNTIRIQDGKAEMADANCPDQICVHTRAAQREGQSIICLPNRVVVEIRNTKKESIDGVSE